VTSEQDEEGAAESQTPNDDFETVLEQLPNAELLGTLDVVLLELEKRLFRYSRIGTELVQIADEGLALTVRARARLTQSLSAAQHAEAHLQVVGVGEWRPTSTKLAWNQDPRLDTTDE